MEKTTSVATLFVNTPVHLYKQYLLYFDKIGLSIATPTKKMEEPIVNRIIEPFNKATDELKKYDVLVQLGISKTPNIEFMKRYGEKEYEKLLEIPDWDYNSTNFLENYGDYFGRFFAAMGNCDTSLTNHYFTPIVSKYSTVGTKSSNIINIVIDAMPIVHPETPLEHIIEFKQNEENYNRFVNLRNWVTEMLHSDLSENEIKEKLEFLINEYERYLKLHKIKYGRGLFKTVVLGGAEMIENIIKFKLKDIAQGIFSVTEQNAELMLSELDAPGREISYLLKANKSFNPK